MRRKEFAVHEQQEIEQFLHEQSYGFLGTVGEDGWSRVTPLNFVYGHEVFYFHGSLAGEKMKHMKSDNRVSFTVAEEYSLIPSYFFDPDLACPATAFFKSVMVKGRAEKVTDLTEKAAALNLFMQKLQPEGGYLPIDAANPEYTGNLKAVSVVKIIPEQISAKFKFGQNMKGARRAGVISGLEDRNQGKDLETIRLMSQYCPFHTD
ncbi:pyridoxamine 5'-phosphate oxidase family protein [Paenibacillus tuaregi]|uniref:pyridoxamine 5'-phosphate oxidase family protein n=1 Tax=Paenibacillus tuaregi TaxID=1816681 RepID=UPI000839099A|nr:pyridoxamine 5'-phosphate oxidase family protein [Paenibacillus tuaregi]